MHWYYEENGQTTGPVSHEELRRLATLGTISASTQVAAAGGEAWIPYSELLDPSGTSTCTECGRVGATSETLRIRSLAVCHVCKPPFVQRLRQGLPVFRDARFGGFWIRAAARAIDSVLLGILNMAVYLPIFGLMMSSALEIEPGSTEMPPELMFMTCGTYLIQFAIGGTYEIVTVVRWGGTPGKLLCGLRVVDEAGERLRWGRASGRFFGYLMTSFTMGIGFLLAVFDEEKRTLHDYIASTRVVKTS